MPILHTWIKFISLPQCHYTSIHVHYIRLIEHMIFIPCAESAQNWNIVFRNLTSHKIQYSVAIWFMVCIEWASSKSETWKNAQTCGGDFERFPFWQTKLYVQCNVKWIVWSNFVCVCAIIVMQCHRARCLYFSNFTCRRSHHTAIEHILSCFYCCCCGFVFHYLLVTLNVCSLHYYFL